MKAFDDVKDIQEPWRFFRKITAITTKHWRIGSPSVFVFIAVVNSLKCTEYLTKHSVFDDLQKKAHGGHSQYSGVISTDDHDSLIKDGKFGYALVMAYQSPRRAAKLEQAMMKMFSTEAGFSGVKANDIKKELLPHLNLAVAYGVD